MGIHKLSKYVTEERKIKFQMLIDGDYVYTSNIIYFDLSYKLVNLYQKYFTVNKQNEVSSDGLITFIKDELSLLFLKLSTDSDVIVFADYRYMKDINISYITANINIIRSERMNALPMIKRKHLKTLLETGEIKSVRCLYELKSLYNICDDGEQTLSKYVNLYHVLDQVDDDTFEYSTNKQIIKNRVQEAINVGVYRYFTLKGLKINIRKNRLVRSFAPYHHDDRVLGNITKTLYNGIVSGRPKLDKYKQFIPYSIITYNLPKIISEINNPKVSYYGCLVESDFALSHHVHTYSLNSFPTIYSCDTDMFCLLCDVPCAIKMDYYYFIDGVRYRELYIINPVTFWFDIFGCTLSPIIIRTLCVLLGSDYNPYHSKSPIHIKSFDAILYKLKLTSFQELTVEKLDEYISQIFTAHPNNLYCQQTRMALSLYNQNHETMIMPLKQKLINSNLFLEHIRATIIEEIEEIDDFDNDIG